MKVTFPRLGSSVIPLEELLTKVGIDPLVPPQLTDRTLKLGVRYAPESACLPFKLILGNLIEGVEAGAKGVMIVGGKGPCRFGHFGELIAEILTELGYQCEVYILEPPVKSIVQIITKLATNFSWFKTLRAVKLAWQKLNLLEEIKDYRLAQGAYLTRQQIHNLENKYQHLIGEAKQSTQLSSIKTRFKDELAGLTATKEPPLVRVGLVGDIYTLLESTANLDVASRLNQLGAAVDRSVLLSKWIKHNLIYGGLGFNSNRRVKQAAQDYLQESVGGLGLETVGESVLYSQKNYDGVVQLAPLGCMPEIIAQSALTKLEQNVGLPTLTMVFDEHASATGVQTRLEAFVDLLVRRKFN
ncbi:MAG: CoA protein activase [Bacillota bacterium]